MRSNDPQLGVGVRHRSQLLATLQPMGALVSNQFTHRASTSTTPRTRAAGAGDFRLRGGAVPNRLTDRTVRHSIAMANHHLAEFLFSGSRSGCRNPCSLGPPPGAPVLRPDELSPQLWINAIENQYRFQNIPRRGIASDKTKTPHLFRILREEWSSLCPQPGQNESRTEARLNRTGEDSASERCLSSPRTR